VVGSLVVFAVGGVSHCFVASIAWVCLGLLFLERLVFRDKLG